LLHIRSDIKIQQLRGNLDTRIKKLNDGRYDAIVVAVAGVKRLGLRKRITQILPVDISLPAIGQGAIGIECRIDDEFINKLIAPLNHPETAICVKAERAFLNRLEGGCQVPIAAYARIKQKARSRKYGAENTNSSLSRFSKGRIPHKSLLIMDGLVGSINGEKIIKGYIEGSTDHAESLGIQLAEDILSRGAKDILDEVYSQSISTGQNHLLDKGGQ
jgi:hydroxymethylbilane synthase